MYHETGKCCRISWSSLFNGIGLSTRLFCISIFTLIEQGCSPHSAPTMEIFGAYFPFWMIFGFIGILSAVATRVIFIRTGWSDVIPFQLIVCSAVGLIIAVVAWVLWIG